jgi:hypothetical protein
MPHSPDPSIPLLRLSDQAPLAEGTQRIIYMHPQDPTRILKVLKPHADTAKRATLATVTERYFPAIRTRWARKEYSEYLRLMLNHAAPFHLPITHMFGFAQTDLGLACISEAVTIDGSLGDTLTKDIAPDDLPLLNDTIARIYRFDIRAGDMTPRNFVFGHRTTHGQIGPRECVLVDGFGDIHAIPVRSWGRWFNHMGLDDSCKRLAARTGLQWDAKQRQFHLT